MNQLQQYIKFKPYYQILKVQSLKADKDLKENTKLVEKLEDLRGKQPNIFSAITESERLAMREQVKGLIFKIDNHLND